MKKIALLIVVALLFVACNQSKQRVINAADFGLSDTLTDATPVMLKVLEACREQKATKLIIPKGRYRFFPLKAYEQYVAVSNNDNSKKRIAFPILDMHGFEIDAQGSEFIFHGFMMPFAVYGSSDIILQNFSIDWDRPFHSEGKVVAVNPVKKTFTLQIADKYPYVIEGQRLFFLGDGFKQDIMNNIWFDPATKATVYRVNDYKMDTWNPKLWTRYGARELQKGLVEVTDTIAQLPQVGWVWAIKGNREPNRLCPAIHLFNSKNLLLQNINIYHAGAMGVVGERCENIALNKVNVLLPPNNDRYVSTTADATHFVGNKGYVKIENSTFENMLDDATNIHGAYTQIVDRPDAYSLGVTLKHAQQFGYTFAAAGDSVALIDNKTLQPIAQLKIKKVKVLNEQYQILSFNQPVPESVRIGFGVENITWYPEFYMANCTVRQNRARSILVSTRKKAVVENNHFSSMMAGISIGGDVNYWFESGAVNDLTIRNNTFENCCTSGHVQAAIQFEPNIMELTDQSIGFHHNIRIEGNTFKMFDRCVLKIKGVDGLVFSNNLIEETQAFTPIFPESATVVIEASKNVFIENNTVKASWSPRVEVDSLSRTVNSNKAFIR